MQCGVVRNDDDRLKDENFVNNYQALVLSPGPQTPSHAGYLMEVISQYHQTKPMLGVCLGHQAIGEYFGATLEKSIIPKHGKVDVAQHKKHSLFVNIPERFEITRYHSLILNNIKPQFHPESCLTKQGLTLIKNFVLMVQQSLR